MDQIPNQKTAFVIFGVTGDLTQRKLLPALYRSYTSGSIPSSFQIIGFARREWNDEILRDSLKQGVIDFSQGTVVSNETLDHLVESARYVRSNFDDIQGYTQLYQLLEEDAINNVVLYLATPPEEYHTIIQNMGISEINSWEKGWVRLVVEKPFGNDLESAQHLNDAIHRVFRENQVYRIDHYLGKETVQNILVFRFANGIFEPLWNRNHIDHIQITVAETVGVGSRAGYFESAGVIRDMFQNHMFQLLSLTAMDAPVTFQADAVRDEKVRVLRCLRPFDAEEIAANVLRAQYASGYIDRERVIGYKEEKGVQPTSTTETFLAVKLFIDNWRWAEVPFYLRSGKRLPNRYSEIAIQFKQLPLSLFNRSNFTGYAPNALVINIQPDEGITLSFGTKTPGHVNKLSPVKMTFDYLDAFGNRPPDAYERLLQDCIIGDATLFIRSDEALTAWGFTDQIIQAWKAQPVQSLPLYDAGTWGPLGVDDFIKRDNREWRNQDRVTPIRIL